MVYEAIFHSTDSEYCHALDCHTIVIRLRAKRGDLTRCVLCYGDRVYPKEIVRVDTAEMTIAASDELFDYFEAVIQTDLTRICYYFILSDGTESVYYYGYAFHQKLDYNRNLYFQLSYVRREDIADVPSWAKEAILYEIFPDSFASGFGFITGARKEITVESGAGTDTQELISGARKEIPVEYREGIAAQQLMAGVQKKFQVECGAGAVTQQQITETQQEIQVECGTEVVTQQYITETRKEIPDAYREGVAAQICCGAATGSQENSENTGIMKNQILSKSKLGGTLRGIIENLPYLENLGINCLYLTPIFTAGEYHKYDTIDYFSVDPCFGDMDTLKELVSECHGRGIRVILDGVFNHCGENFFAFRDVLENGEKSRYKDWFFIRDYPVRTNPPNYECFAYVKSMPKLNTGNPEVVAYFTEVGRYWIREAGIDGWRLDVANEVNHDFWRAFRKAVSSVKPDAFLIGEIWFDAREWLMGDQFDSLMNYGFAYACIDFFAKRVIHVKQFDDRMGYLRMRYKKNIQQAQMNLLDSHDVPRFLSLAGGDIRKLKLAVLFMMTHVGIPTIYYGDEKGMDGLKEDDYRKPMLWRDTQTSRELTDFYRKLISIRKENMDLMTGEYKTIDADLIRNTLVYARETNGKRLYVILNNSEFPVQYALDISRGDPGKIENETVGKGVILKDLLSGRQYHAQGSVVTVTLDELSGAILIQES